MKTRAELLNIWKNIKEEFEANTDGIKTLIPKKIREEFEAKNKSLIGYIVIKKQMVALKYSGEPYEDAKTFNLWKKSGYCVKKGEKSNLFGIVWKIIKDKDTDDVKFMFPKSYSLFHRNQVVDLSMKTKLKKLKIVL